MSILEVLTEYLLVRVNSRIEDGADRRSWRLVCKEFLRVDFVTRKSLWVLRSEFIFSLLRRFPNVGALDLSACPRVDDGMLTLLLARGAASTTASLRWNLKSLNLSRATKGMSFKGLALIASACSQLEKLDVSYNCQLRDREAAAISGIEGLCQSNPSHEEMDARRKTNLVGSEERELRARLTGHFVNSVREIHRSSQRFRSGISEKIRSGGCGLWGGVEKDAKQGDEQIW
ncbi:unnamed protein product [Linum trigynum]|uniref:Uncharacterized protein n=1 Tax=Linum trigynum TaxID=586398 RepID=A0AAV2DTA6_9ROSI